MIWNIIYSRRNKQRRGGPKDDLDLLIDAIEKFAPSEHISDRESHFYNYRIMAPYKRPLSVLLETIAQRERLGSDHAAFSSELFVRLKTFYDPKDKLPLDEAKRDFGLLRKFRDLFLFFYGQKNTPAIENMIESGQA